MPQTTRLNITPEEKLPPESNSGWTMWQCLNRLRTGIAKTKTELKKWGLLIQQQTQPANAELTMALSNTN